MAMARTTILEPRASLVGLQLSLFSDEDFLHLESRQAEQAIADAMNAVENAVTQKNTSNLPPPEKPAMRRGRRVKEPEGPVLQLDDEGLQFFRDVGCRMLLAEMVIQTVRDMAALTDPERCQRLQQLDPQSWEELQASAQWFDTEDGRIAIQLLFPEWDHETIINRIKADPNGVINRFYAWASLAPKRLSKNEGVSGMDADTARLIGADVDVEDWGPEDSVYACRA